MRTNDILTINDSLNTKIWTEAGLDGTVKEKLLAVTQDFFDKLELEQAELEDVTFTGSLANFNYTKYSDIDLHLLVDFSKVDDSHDLVREYFSAKTALWNKTHDIFVNGYEIEIYVQNTDEDHHSTGVYSLNNDEWIAQPLRIEPEIDTDMVKRKISSFIDMVERVEDEYEDKKYERANSMSVSLVKKIKKFRKSGLEDKGEYSNENLVFKYLRNKGFLNNLFKLRDLSYDKMMSLQGDFSKKFKIFVDQDQNKEEPGFHRIDELGKFQKRVKKHHKPGFGGS